jgi:hypothetical protein
MSSDQVQANSRGELVGAIWALPNWFGTLAKEARKETYEPVMNGLCLTLVNSLTAGTQPVMRRSVNQRRCFARIR